MLNRFTCYIFLTRDLLEIHCIVRLAVTRMRERCLNTGLSMFVLLTAGTLSLLSHAAVLRMCCFILYNIYNVDSTF